jgi:hypothetical protein
VNVVGGGSRQRSDCYSIGQQSLPVSARRCSGLPRAPDQRHRAISLHMNSPRNLGHLFCDFLTVTQAGCYGIALYLSNCRQQAPLVHWGTVKWLLSWAATPRLAKVDSPRVSPVRFTESAQQPIRVRRSHHEADVIWHEAPRHTFASARWQNVCRSST